MIAQRFSYDDIKKRFLLVIFSKFESTCFYEAEMVDNDHLENNDDIQGKWVLLNNQQEIPRDKLITQNIDFHYDQSMCV